MRLIAAGGELEFVWLLVVVLIGIVSAVRAWIQKRMVDRQREERGLKPTPPVATQVRQEVLKYLGEIRPSREKPPSEELPEGHAEAAARTGQTALREPSPPSSPPLVVVPPLASTEEVVRQRITRKARRRAPEPRPGTATGRIRLDRRDELRRAVLYREILGPPVGMRRMVRTPSRLTRR